MSEPLHQWITQKEASELMGKSLNSIHQLVRNNRLRTKKIFGKRLVHLNDVMNFTAIKSGRPKKNES